MNNVDIKAFTRNELRKVLPGICKDCLSWYMRIANTWPLKPCRVDQTMRMKQKKLVCHRCGLHHYHTHLTIHRIYRWFNPGWEPIDAPPISDGMVAEVRARAEKAFGPQ